MRIYWTAATRIFCAAVFSSMLFLLGGCANGNARTIIDQAPTAQVHFKSLKIVEVRSGAVVPDDQRNAFREKLEHRLYNTGSFVKGDDFTLQYTFTEYDPGSQLGRLFFGVTNADSEANVIVQCTFLTPDGKSLSKAEFTSRLTGGLLVLGGSAETVLDKAADKIRDYTAGNFGSGM